MGDTLGNLPWAVTLARSAHRTVIRNLVWAVAYNVVGIAFAISGNLNPIIAAIAMIGSSLFVLSSSLSFAAQSESVASSGEGQVNNEGQHSVPEISTHFASNEGEDERTMARFAQSRSLAGSKK